jgi:hypothetical protein
MANAIVKMYATVNSRLSALEVKDGQLIFTTDTKQLFLDYNGLRLAYNCVQVFPTDEDRKAVLAPVEGFYFVENTAILWRYKEGWTQISPDNLNPVYMGGVDTFPAQGDTNTLYVADDAIYKWDTLTNDYIMVSNKTIWSTL